ncbi:COG4671 Predicted glycosyl transferase [Rhabdaerophilaceae bacterium]
MTKPDHQTFRSDTPKSLRGPRLLMYSHDTFGLGHIRRTRAIANAVVSAHGETSVLIISGSPLAGSFNFGDGIDFVHIPSVSKLKNGGYSSGSLRMDIKEVVALRQAIIHSAAQAFAPDIFIADKEPTGFQGELLPTLSLLAKSKTRMIVGIRDVLDDPETVRNEWQARGALAAVIDYYNDVFVYGSEAFYRPLDGVPLPPECQSKISYTGYLRRAVPKGPAVISYPKMTKSPFILATTGGGGDGASMIDLVISAYEVNKSIPLPMVVVFGPFLSRTQRRSFLDRIELLPNVEAIAFDPKIERLMNRATAIVAMGGYNTFCEILSFDKPSLILPRSFPRLEQTIRASRAAELGLVRMFEETGDAMKDSHSMALELSQLADRPRPSAAMLPDLLEGLPRVTASLMPTLKRVARNV